MRGNGTWQWLADTHPQVSGRILRGLAAEAAIDSLLLLLREIESRLDTFRTAKTFELNVLAIANHDGRQGAGFPSRSFLDINELVWLALAFACFATLVWSFFQTVF